MNMGTAGVLGIYLVMSAVALAMYGVDKRRSGRGEWRISEGTLHGIELCGPCPPLAKNPLGAVSPFHAPALAPPVDRHGRMIRQERDASILSGWTRSRTGRCQCNVHDAPTSAAIADIRATLRSGTSLGTGARR